MRDASGNIISIYSDQSGTLALTEQPIYGSGKTGTSFRNPTKHKFTYELTDHLSNVGTVISKLKFFEVAKGSFNVKRPTALHQKAVMLAIETKTSLK